MTDICNPTADRPVTPPVAERQGVRELKFLVSLSQAEQIVSHIRGEMLPDPDARSAEGDCYRVTSLYFDTDGLDIFHRTPGFRRRKLRVRRYGDECVVHLEQKAKKRGRVQKHRQAIPLSDLLQLQSQESKSDWAGHDFHTFLNTAHMAPRCLVGYERVARVMTTPDGPARLTVDRNFRCQQQSDLEFAAAGWGTPLLEGRSIVEFKYQSVLPALFKSLVSDLVISPVSVSKYRLSLAACTLNSAALPIGQES